MPYTVPDSLTAEIDGLESCIRRFQAGELEAAALKAQRVPFGVYEQRAPGTYMVRIRCTGGTLAPGQLAEAARLSISHGSGLLHLTTRQDLQIHGVDLGRVIDLQRRLLDLGLSSRGGGGNTVRNIMASTEADPAAPFDPGPWVDALTDRVIREGDSWTLPRKFKIAFSDTDADTALAGFNDLGFFARTGPQGQPGFKVYVAGGLGGKPRTALPFFDFIPAPDLHLVVTAVKQFFDRNGNRRNRRQARLRFLRDRFGDEGLVAQLRAEVETLRASGFPALEAAAYRQGAGAEPRVAPVAAPGDGFEAWRRHHVVPEGTGGRSSVLLPILLGDLLAEEALALARAVEPFGPRALRLDQHQNLRLVGIPDTHLGAVFTRVKGLLDFSPAARFISRAVACTGADTCKLGMCLPKGAVRELHRRLRGSELDLDALAGLRLHLSGCPNSCAQHLIADLGFFGIAQRQGQHVYPAYTVVAGGRVGEGRARLAEEIGRVSARELPGFIVAVLERFLAERAPRATFATWLEAGGGPVLRDLIAALPPVPALEKDPSAYFDWGSSERFSPSRGGAECSAGLFDLIDLDRQVIAGRRQALAGEQDAGRREAGLQAIALSASRMLLVTRSIEAATDREVYDAFLDAFVREELVDPGFEAIVAAARDRAGLAGREDEVLALAEAVETLYQGMDDSLRFPRKA
jgi:sulfite reductase (ferredoxin)